MGSPAQTRALKSYRKRLHQRGIARFEVLGLATDRDLIRTLAKKLAEDGPEAAEMRAVLHSNTAVEPPAKGGILAALRSSPLVGADLHLVRPFIKGRKADL
jgi:hypothetical protein